MHGLVVMGRTFVTFFVGQFARFLLGKPKLAKPLYIFDNFRVARLLLQQDLIVSLLLKPSLSTKLLELLSAIAHLSPRDLATTAFTHVQRRY